MVGPDGRKKKKRKKEEESEEKRVGYFKMIGWIGTAKNFLSMLNVTILWFGYFRLATVKADVMI